MIFAWIRSGMSLSLVVLVLMCLLLGCSGEPGPVTDEAGASSHLETILERGKLTMLCYPNLDSENVSIKIEVLQETGLTLAELRDPAHFKGTDVERITRFAEFLGVELEILPITTSYGDLIEAVVEMRGDLAASSLCVTPERLQRVDFSDPTGAVWAVVAVPLDSDVTSLNDLVGKKGVAMKGSSQLEIFRSQAPEGIELQLASFNVESYAMVEEVEADFMLMDSEQSVGEPARKGYENVKVAVRLVQTNYGIAVPKGSDLLPRLNEFLAQDLETTP
jgi:ABC-type amino acid transport substrate-binding protein